MAVVAKSRARVVAITTPEDIRVAVGAVAHVAPAAQSAVRAMLQRRAAQVGGVEHIPPHWHPSGQARRLGTDLAVQMARAGSLELAEADVLELAGKWKHGWIPLDAVAALVKAKKYHGGSGDKGSLPTGKNRRLGKGRAGEAVMASRGLIAGRVKGANGPRGVAPKPKPASGSSSGLRARADEAGDLAESFSRTADADGRSGTKHEQAARAHVVAAGRALNAGDAAASDRHRARAAGHLVEASRLSAADDAAMAAVPGYQGRLDAGRAEFAARVALGVDEATRVQRRAGTDSLLAAADKESRAARAGRAASRLRESAALGRAGDHMPAAREPVRMKGSELRSQAAGGDKIAQAELDRRAASRSGKATAAAQQVAQDRYRALEAKRVGREEAAGVRSWTDEELHSAISAHGSDTRLGTRAHAELERRGKPVPLEVGPRREAHISAKQLTDGRTRLSDSDSGESVSAVHLASFHSQGHTITGVRGGLMHTRDDSGEARVYDPATGRAAAPRSVDAGGGVRIEHSGDGTLVHGTSRADKATNDVLKAQGFKWSNKLDAWYLPRTWGEATRSQRVRAVQGALGDKVTVDRGSLARSTTAEERATAHVERAGELAGLHTAKAAALSAEADARFGRAKGIADRIPMGQPILVGHHSERRHRADLAKIDGNMRKGVEAHTASQLASQRAESAAAEAGSYDNPQRITRRLERNEAELRRLSRILDGTGKAIHGHDVPHPAGEHRDRLTAMRADLTDQVARDRRALEASGATVHSSATVKPGHFVKIRGSLYEVSKANPKTVEVKFHGRTAKYPYGEVRQVIDPEAALSKSSDEKLAEVIAKTPGTPLAVMAQRILDDRRSK